MARYLAIDWDQNQLHLAEATISGSSVRLQRAVVSQEEHSPFTTPDPESLGKLLRERLKTAGIAPAPVLACVGRDRVIQKDLRFPSVPEHEEPALVRFQALKELSEAPEDVVIDFSTTTDGAECGETRALTLILRRDVLEAYQKVCAAAGLKLVALTPRPIGLSACLRRVMGTTALTPAPEPPDAAVVIVTAAEKWAEFCVVRGKALLFARFMAPGPNLAGDVRRNLAVYAGQNAQFPVKAIYLAGSGIAAVRERLTEAVEVPIYSFDPFAGAERPELPINHRGSFAGAVGLCYARAERAGLAINFAQPRQPRQPADPQKRKMLALAALAVVVIAGLFVFAQSLLGREEQAARLAVADDKEIGTVRDQRREELARFKAMDDWDGVVWLDEIYNMAANIPDVNALRITQVKMEPQSINAKNKRYAAKIVLKGYLTDRSGDHHGMNQFMAAMQKDGHYNPGSPIWTPGNNFSLTVEVEKRAPEAYKEEIKAK
jgi:Tfp pilus assembly PilM family ATPase